MGAAHGTRRQYTHFVPGTGSAAALRMLCRRPRPAVMQPRPVLTILILASSVAMMSTDL
jgi:hypothetical protein